MKVIAIALYLLCSAAALADTMSDNPLWVANRIVDDSELTEKEAIERAKLSGCQLIPYQKQRDQCVQGNMGLHDATACGAEACKKSVDRKINLERLAAWKQCDDKRVNINGAFSNTLKVIMAFQSKSPQYKRWSQQAKSALNTIVDKIRKGQKGHDIALGVAEENLKHCEQIVL